MEKSSSCLGLLQGADALMAETLSNQTDVLMLAARLEKGATNAYLGVIPAFADSSLPATTVIRISRGYVMVRSFSGTAGNEFMKQSVSEIFPAHRITKVEQLDDHYGAPAAASLDKEIDHISGHYRAFIEKAPFVTVATCGPEGLDCSPRGDPPGFVRVVDEKTLMIPDRRGNNRIDSMRNLVRDPRISLLFLIPGVNETLRINGRAEIVVDPDLCASFAIRGKLPRSIMVVTVERIYFQCQKALVRSRLWDVEAQIPRSELPSTGKILEALSDGDFDGVAYDRSNPEQLKKTIY